NTKELRRGASVLGNLSDGSAGRGLGEFDLDPQVDLGQYLVDARITRKVLEVGGGGLEPRQHGGLEPAGPQRKLHLVGQVERRVAAFDGTPPALVDRFHALQRKERVDAGDGANAAGRGRRGGGLFLRQAEGAGRGAACKRCAGGGGRSVRSRDAHDEGLL